MKHRKLHVLSLLLVLTCFLLSACQGEPELKAGTYEGQGQGQAEGTPIRLSVSIDEKGEIYEVKILEQKETPDLGGKALDELVKQVETKKTGDIDMISGATRTSEGFKQALDQALDQARKAAKSGQE